MFNIGDKVIFMLDKINNTLNCRGMIVGNNEDCTYNILYFDNSYTRIAYDINSIYISPILHLEDELIDINEKYDYLIAEEKKKLKTVSQTEKEKERLIAFNDIKQRIVKNCEWLLTKDIDEEDFINRIKEISNLKKQLFSPKKLPCIDEIHKHNGTIKYNIRKLESERNKIIERLAGKKEVERWNKL